MEESKQNKIVLLRQMIENAERNVAAAKQILSQLDNGLKESAKNPEVSQIIEGTFDGEKMTGLDGKSYPVPANYASKSKLIEGDLLKLSITEDGRFLYKQISPADRRKVLGFVMKDDNDKYYVSAEGKKYKVLLASLTYFKAKNGDEVTLVVPKEKISAWAAIEAVMENVKESKSYSNQEANNAAIENIKDMKPQSVEDFENNDDEELDDLNNKRRASIEDEWVPDAEEIMKEARFDGNEDDKISDDLTMSN